MDVKHEKEEAPKEEKSVSQKLLDELLSVPSDFANAFTKRPVTSIAEFLILDPLAPLIHEKFVKQPARRPIAK